MSKFTIGQHNAKFVVLRRINTQQVIYTKNDPLSQRDVRCNEQGVLTYEIVAYTLTQEEAHAIFLENVPQFLRAVNC